MNKVDSTCTKCNRTMLGVAEGSRPVCNQCRTITVSDGDLVELDASGKIRPWRSGSTIAPVGVASIPGHGGGVSGPGSIVTVDLDGMKATFRVADVDVKLDATGNIAPTNPSFTDILPVGHPDRTINGARVNGPRNVTRSWEVVPCPACRAPEGSPCQPYGTNGSASKAVNGGHPSRRDAAKKAPQGVDMFTKGMKVGTLDDGTWVPSRDLEHTLGIVINQPQVEGVTRIDVFRGCEKLAGGDRVETTVNHPRGKLATSIQPLGSRPPLLTISAVEVQPLQVITGLRGLPAGVRSTVLRVERKNSDGVFSHVVLRVRRWDTDRHHDVTLAPADTVRVGEPDDEI